MKSGLGGRNNGDLKRKNQIALRLVSMESGLRGRNNQGAEGIQQWTAAVSQWSPVLETGTIFVEGRVGTGRTMTSQ